jgi:hypothetical protein
VQFPGQGRQPVGIVFDTDMGDRIDGALALALLYGLDGKNEARLVSVSVSKANLNAAAFCDAVGRFYGGEVSGAFGAIGRTLPIGLADDGKSPGDTPMLTVPLARQGPDGKPVYAHGIHNLNDTAEVAALIRNALTSQQDHNAIVVLAGPANNLVRILDLPGVPDLIARKTRLLSVAAGAYPNGTPDAAIQADIASARRLFAEWPTPVVAAGSEVGAELPFPGASIEKDFAWSPAHPVVDAYRAYHTMPYDAPAAAVAAALYAVRPQEGYFQLSEAGTIAVLDDGRTRFTASAGGRHRYLIVDPGQKGRVIRAYVELASAKPVPRTRFRPQPKKDDPPIKKQ